MSTAKDLTGMRFGRYVVVERVYDGKRRPRWHVHCDCGTDRVVYGSSLLAGRSTSCGCFAKENMSRIRKTHGGWADNDPLFNVWISMRKRCSPSNKDNPRYKYYAGRGITVCNEWQDFTQFRDWALESGYRHGLSIDRIDGDKGYSPENCRWATNKQQQNNRSCTLMYELNGEVHTLKEWSELYNISYDKLWKRIRKFGYSLEESLCTHRINRQK